MNRGLSDDPQSIRKQNQPRTHASGADHNVIPLLSSSLRASDIRALTSVDRAISACARSLDEQHFLVGGEWPVVISDDGFEFVDDDADGLHRWLDLL